MAMAMALPVEMPAPGKVCPAENVIGPVIVPPVSDSFVPSSVLILLLDQVLTVLVAASSMTPAVTMLAAWPAQYLALNSPPATGPSILMAHN